jgi:hypothetical protein
VRGIGKAYIIQLKYSKQIKIKKYPFYLNFFPITPQSSKPIIKLINQRYNKKMESSSTIF